MAVLESPSGDKYETDSKVEITRLTCRGYKVVDEKPEPPKPQPPKPQPPKPDGS